ncbi:MAG: hypothetical protein ABH862_00545 [Candidatus Omnitrophota bacterium]
MAKKVHKHNFTVNDKRREKKRTTDFMSKGSGDQLLKVVFNTVYKDQVRALYNAVSKTK